MTPPHGHRHAPGLQLKPGPRQAGLDLRLWVRRPGREPPAPGDDPPLHAARAKRSGGGAGISDESRPAVALIARARQERDDRVDCRLEQGFPQRQDDGQSVTVGTAAPTSRYDSGADLGPELASPM
jgi:hypothetical protein